MTEKILSVVIGGVFVVGAWLTLLWAVWFILTLLEPPTWQTSYWQFAGWLTLFAFAVRLIEVLWNNGRRQ